MGGAGEGPGEFTSLWGLFLRGDSLVAHDFRLSRLTSFDLQGEHLGEVTLDRSAGLPLRVYPGVDGYLGVLQGFPGELTEEFTYSRRRLTYRMYDDAGLPLHVVDELPGQEILMRGSVSGTAVTATSTTPFVSHSAYQTVVDGRLVAGTTDRFELRVYDGEGALRRLIRAPGRDRPVSSAEWEEIVAEALDESEDAEGRRRVLDLAELKPAPDLRPAYGRFVADPPGHVWIEPYRPARGRPVPWIVVELDGTVLGEVDLPERFTPLDIGPRSVLGVVRDDLDVPYVHLYELSR
jgi:hypothetical protein